MSPETKINQANLDLLFKNHPLPMWIYDIQSLAFLEVNDAAVKKYGYSRKKFLSMTLKDIRPKEDVSRLMKDISKKRHALQQSRNWRHKLKSGKIIEVEIIFHTIKYNGRKAALVTARDITDQKLAEEKIVKLIKVYAVLSEVNQTIVRTRNAKELFKSICRIAVEKGGYAMAWIGIVDKKDNKVKVIASAGTTKDYLKKINIDLNDKKRGGGPTGLAVKTGKHVISNNIEKDKRMLPWRKDAVKYGYKFSASFPIKVLGKVIGSFTLYSSQEYFFNDEEIRLLDEMVRDLSFALEFIEKEKERREAEEKLKLTQFGIDHSQIGVFQIDEEGNINYANEKACKSLGYTYSELTSMSVLDIDPTFSLKKWKEHRKNLRKKGSGTIETIHKRKDGTEFFVEATLNYFDYDGKKISFSFAKDITERKQAEEALRESEQLLRESQEMVRTGSYVLDLSKDRWSSLKILDDILRIDENYIRSFEGWTALVHPEWREIITKYFTEDFLRKHKSFDKEYKIIRIKDGKERWVHSLGKLELDKKNRAVKVIETISDITERKLLEEELREREERFRNLVENINEVFYITDKEGRITYCSPNLTTAIGFALKEILGNSYLPLIAPIDRRMVIDHYLELTSKGASDTVLEFRVRCKDGKIIWVEQITNIVRDTSGSVVEYRNVTRDITDRKQSEEALRESKQVIEGIINTIPV